MSEADVTIVVVPRERFSYTRQSLESIYQNTRFPFDLVYVDGNSPPEIKRYLEAESRGKGFRLIRTDHYLSPNQARNLGLAHVRTRYVVFIDNDVLVTAGWLETLVNRAEATGAWLVGPLTLLGSDFKKVHFAGGSIELREQQGKNWMTQKRPFMNQPLANVQDKIEPGNTEILELHCMLARTEAFDTLGPLDEAFMSMCEEDDLCMSVAKTGHSIFLESGAVVTYVPPSPTDIAWSDLPFFFVRWSDSWCEKSVARCTDKWNLTDDSPFLGNTRYFVRAHRTYINPRPAQVSRYIVYGLKRLLLLNIVQQIMNRKADQLFLRQAPARP